MPSPLVCAGATLSARAPDDDIARKTSLLVQRLADEATRARQEVDRLHTTRSQWVPPVCKKAVKLPTVCARPLADAQAHERRAVEEDRRMQIREAEVKRLAEQRDEVQRKAGLAICAAHERQRLAERDAEGTLTERRLAEVVYKESLSEGERRFEADMKLLSEKTEDARHTAEVDALKKRQEVAGVREAHSQRLADLRAEFAQRCSDLQQSVDDYEKKCNAEVCAAGDRIKDAHEVATKTWGQVEEMMRELHSNAERQVREHQVAVGVTLESTNVELEAIDADLTSHLKSTFSRQKYASLDRTADVQAEEMIAEVEDDICERGLKCEEFVQHCDDQIRSFRDEMASAATQASYRARLVQETSDSAVDAIILNIERYSQFDYSSKIKAQHLELNCNVRAMRQGVCQRLKCFNVLMEKETEEASNALLASGLRVKEVRANAAARIDHEMTKVQRQLKTIKDERMRIAREAEARTGEAQHRMVDFAQQQQEELAVLLRKPEPTPENLGVEP